MGEESAADRRRFDHERLDVYRLAVDFAVWERDVLKTVPRGNADLVDQIRRAAGSVVLNIAEGSGEFSPAERIHFYRMARRSATECAAALDLMERAARVPATRLSAGRTLIARVVAMLSVLTRPDRTAS